MQAFCPLCCQRGRAGRVFFCLGTGGFCHPPCQFRQCEAGPAFADLGLYERSDLQRLLRDAISALGEDLLVVAEEFGYWEDARRRIDLLALDRAGHLVVIELKRDETGGHMELQAIRYAAMVSSMGFAEVAVATPPTAPATAPARRWTPEPSSPPSSTPAMWLGGGRRGRSQPGLVTPAPTSLVWRQCLRPEHQLRARPSGRGSGRCASGGR